MINLIINLRNKIDKYEYSEFKILYLQKQINKFKN